MTMPKEILKYLLSFFVCLVGLEVFGGEGKEILPKCHKKRESKCFQPKFPGEKNHYRGVRGSKEIYFSTLNYDILYAIVKFKVYYL